MLTAMMRIAAMMRDGDGDACNSCEVPRFCCVVLFCCGVGVGYGGGVGVGG